MRKWVYLLYDNENTMATHHPKIMCAKVITPSFGVMEVVLDELERLLYEGNNRELIGQIELDKWDKKFRNIEQQIQP